MNPFAELMRELRLRRGLRQADMASLLGCPRKTVTAVEGGDGRGIRIDLVERVCAVLDLSEAERLELENAARHSQRVYAIPDEVPSPVYQLVRELFDRIDRLTALEIEAIRLVLKMHSDRQPAAGSYVPRLVRRDKVWRNNTVP